MHADVRSDEITSRRLRAQPLPKRCTTADTAADPTRVDGQRPATHGSGSGTLSTPPVTTAALYLVNFGK